MFAILFVFGLIYSFSVVVSLYLQFLHNDFQKPKSTKKPAFFLQNKDQNQNEFRM